MCVAERIKDNSKTAIPIMFSGSAAVVGLLKRTRGVDDESQGSRVKKRKRLNVTPGKSYEEIGPEFNLGFHVPSKDLCDTCTKFDMKKESGTFHPSDEAELINHLRRKEQARTAKSVDKFVGDTITAVFDLQQVMVAPKLFVGSGYYLRKLNVYNFTVLELQTLQGFCYTWHECEGKRGTNEIASCLLKWLKAKDNEGYHSAILYSDSCGGQNRNRIMCSAILQFLSQAQNIEFVEQKYFESGHSQNECDSMHSCIEREYKSSNVFLPSAYHESMRKANKKTALYSNRKYS
ncbi:hypothetical protein LOTGIDRAFT_155116 [Lottia gigantea]|uniref:DUF7869 domain-containing protein n=1 Tax=Lottia gigantea TaxID=225164 RepID=V3ZXD6_LOTGI|nr:hypothetical protein LOTGIDRAFT_155116 [Lottia gigantea]ESO85626.1 hypothetical protein LOTGIDRAFT_155116 [Lottia gigantea]